MFESLHQLRECVVECRLCPRLVKFRETVVPKKVYENEFHCRRPVPGFGDPKAQVLFLGLAPSPDGGNRTGRPFTGDISGRFLFPMLYEEGFANQPLGEAQNDGLQLINCYLTAAVKCVPPEHKPTRQEQITCSRYYRAELELLKRLKCIVALGKFAFDAHMFYLRENGIDTKGLVFKHGSWYHFDAYPSVFCSYHPSPMNTQTGKLTPSMFKSVLKTIKSFLSS